MNEEPLQEILTTDEILAKTVKNPLHLDPDPSYRYVSTTSLWRDQVWRLDLPPSMRRMSGVIYWSFELPDGTCLTDPQHSVLLESLRRLEWWRMAEIQFHTQGKASTACHNATHMRRLARWMVAEFHQDFSTLDSDAFGYYIDFLVDEKINCRDYYDEEFDEEEETSVEEGGESDGLGASLKFLHNAIVIWSRIWRSTRCLKSANIPVMPEDPLEGKKAYTIARELCDRVSKLIPPLPDEVAVPIMNEASRWLGTIADDIIRLYEHYRRIVEMLRKRQETQFIRISEDEAKLFNEFSFSIEAGKNEPWHAPILSVKGVDGFTLPTRAVRTLIDALRTACVISLNGEGGMRPGELSGLAAGHDPARDEHNAIEIRTSPKGLHDLFFLRSLKHKSTPSAEEEEWVIASRPVGSPFVPDPYRAVYVLERLLAPHRNEANKAVVRASLLVNFADGNGLSYNGDGSHVRITEPIVFRRLQRNFIERYVDLSKIPDQSKLGEDLTVYRESKGRCITPSQWRKTFARYVIRTDPMMLPAIKQQFKHLYVATTEASYLGRDPAFFEELESQQARAAATFMYARTTGRAPTAGRVSKLIDEYEAEVRAVIGAKEGVSAINAVQDWCEQRHIKVFCSPHGKCFIGLEPTAARCHQIAGTVHWSRVKPNFETREPDVCNGCKVFGVDDDHAEFWVERYISYGTSWEKAKKSGLTKGFRVVQERAAQSEKILRILEIPVPKLGEDDDG